MGQTRRGWCWSLVSAVCWLVVSLLGCGWGGERETLTANTPSGSQALRLLELNFDPQQQVVLTGHEISSGEIEVTVEGSGTVYVTLDGTLPAVSNDRPVGSTVAYSGPVRLRTPTLMRAVACGASGCSFVRSRVFLPRIWDVRCSGHFPGDSVKSVYVTGEFRGWAVDFDEAFRLRSKPDGTWSTTLKLEKSVRTEYKFFVRHVDDSVTWFLDSNLPKQNGNNVLPAPLELLRGQFVSGHDGFVEEAALDLSFNPSIVLDKGDNVIRFQFVALDGDLDEVRLRYRHGSTSASLVKSTFVSEGLPYAAYAAYLSLDAGVSHDAFVYEVRDGQRVFEIGPEGLLSPGSCTMEDCTKGFQVEFDASRGTINGEPISQVPLWAIDAIWYQIFPERFRNGDTSNDAAPSLPIGWDSYLSEADLDTMKRMWPKSVRPWNSDWFGFSTAEENSLNFAMGHWPFDPWEWVRGKIKGRGIFEQDMIMSRRYGGDLRGIREKIPYLVDLGINAVYLNPVFDSPSEHKYDTRDYRHVDPHFGPMLRRSDGRVQRIDDDLVQLGQESVLEPWTWGYTAADKEFMLLVNELHRAGIRVVIDGVFNHSDASSIYMEDIAKNGRASPFFNWFELAYKGDDGYDSMSCKLEWAFPDPVRYPHAAKVRYASWWGFCNMPNHREGYPDSVFHPTLRQHIFDVVDRWLRPKLVDGISFDGVDGIRLDVYGDVSSEFWRQFRTKVKSVKPDALIISEEWSDAFHFLKGDEVDINMNYRFRTLVEGWFVNVDRDYKMRPSWAKSFVDFRMQKHREHVKYALWNMLDSHDTDRMLSKLIWFNRTLTTRPEQSNDTWDGEINRPHMGSLYSNDQPGNAERQMLKSIAAFQMAFVGAPVIYYGSEVGMWGADDPTNRKPMLWDDTRGDGQFETRCVTKVGRFCEPRSGRFQVAPDEDLRAAYRRLIRARREHPALRRGSINTTLLMEIDGRRVYAGTQDSDRDFVWGFSREYADWDFAYFVSNQNLDRAAIGLRVETRFAPGSRVRDVLTQNVFDVEHGGFVRLSLQRDRAVLLVGADGVRPEW